MNKVKFELPEETKEKLKKKLAIAIIIKLNLFERLAFGELTVQC